MKRRREGRTGQRATGREVLVSEIAQAYLAERCLDGRWLVVDDHGGAVEQLLSAHGLSVGIWRRWAFRPGGPGEVRPWPPQGPFEAAFLRLPRDWDSFELQLHLIASHLTPGGRLLVAGANDEGIRSAPRRMGPLFGDVATRVIKNRCRLLEGTRLEGPAPRGEAKHWRRQIELALPLDEEVTESISIVTYPGVFAAGRLDQASALLIAHLRQLRGVAPGPRLLDFGCGHGVLALAARRWWPEARITLLDIDALALDAAGENLPEAERLLSDGWSAVAPERRFDLILSNPPIHRGKEEDFSALEALAGRAGHFLAPQGRLLFVVQRTVGAGRLLRRSLPRALLLAETPRFQLWQGRP